MSDLWIVILVLVGWFVINTWLLPRRGIST